MNELGSTNTIPMVGDTDQTHPIAGQGVKWHLLTSTSFSWNFVLKMSIVFGVSCVPCTFLSQY